MSAWPTSGERRRSSASTERRSPPGRGSVSVTGLRWGDVELPLHGVDHVAGHDAVGGELAAADGEDAGGAEVDDVLAAGAAGASLLAVAAGHEGADAGPGADDVGAHELGLGEEGVGGGEQVFDVGLAGADLGGVGAGGGLRGADDGVLAGGEHEHDAAVHGGQEREGVAVAEPLARHGDVDALAATHGGRLARGIELADLVAPGTGGVDEGASADGDLLAGEVVHDDGAAGLALLDDELAHGGVVEDDGAGLGGAQGVGEGEARVVGGGVVVAGAAREALGAQAGARWRAPGGS